MVWIICASLAGLVLWFWADNCGVSTSKVPDAPVARPVPQATLTVTRRQIR